MGKCLAEIAHSMKRNNGMTRLLLVLCILCFGGGKMLCSYMKTMGQANEKFEKTYLEQNIYPVASLFDGGYEDYEKPENYGKLLQ